MPEHIHTFSKFVRGDDGTEYEARVYGDVRPGGTWAGWLEFRAVSGDGPVLRTGQETSQPDHRALDYWAGGLEPVYLAGALRRAADDARRRAPT